MAKLIKTPTGYQIAPAGTTTKTTTKKKASSAAAKAMEDSKKQQIIKAAQEAGLTDVVKKLEQPPKLSLLQRLGKGLTSFETGDAVYAKMYEDQPFLKSYSKNILKGLSTMVTGIDYEKEPKHTFKDIMVREGFRDRPGKLDAVDIAGLAGDIMLDPTTYLGGFLGKGAVKGVKVVGGIGKKIPLVKGVMEGVEDLFKPFAKIERLGEIGKKYTQSYLNYAKSTRSQMDDFMEEIAKRAKTAEKIMPGAGKKIAQVIETPVAEGATKTTGVKLLDDVMDDLIKSQETRTVGEKARGLLQSELPDYMRHLITPQAREYYSKGGDIVGLVKPLRAKLAASKTRKLAGTAAEINTALKDKLGFNLFEEDAFKAFASRGVESIKAVKTYDFLKQTAETFGKKSEADFFENGVRYLESTAPQLKGYRLPEPIVKHIDEVNKVLTNDEATNKFLNVYDKINNFWKGTVTGYFPSFHTRNAMGGVFNNWIAGLNNPLVYKQASNILKGQKGSVALKGGKVLSNDEVLKLAKEYGVIGQTGYLDVVNYLQKEVNPTIANKLASAPQKVMGVIENNIRLPLFVDGLKKGYTAEEAAKRVVKFHFDYMPEGFTAFEKNIMKRIIPFYTWTRNNIPLQIEQMIMQPGKYAGLFKVQRSAGIQPGAEEESILPRWIKEQFYVKGEGGYWAGFGLPLEEATQKLSAPLRGFGTSITPLIKTPLERLTNYNIFKERKITEDTYGKDYRNVPEPVKQWLEFRETKGDDGKKYYTVNPHKKYWLEVIGARGLMTALRVANSTDDKKNLWSLITTIKKYNYTDEDLKSWAERDKVKQMEEALFNAGIIRKYENFYIPKKK